MADWHYFLLDAQKGIRAMGDQERAKAANLYLLNRFFLTPYDGNREFYVQFYERLEEARGRWEEL